MLKHLLSLLFILFTFKAMAQPDFHRDGLGTATYMDIIMASNPPLPMVDLKEGTYKFSIQPTKFSGTNEYLLFENSFKGYSAALNYSKAVTDKWGWYVGALDTSFTSDHRANLFIYEVFLTNIEANFLSINGGVHGQFIKQSGFIPSINFMAGPYLKFANFSQSYKKVNSSSVTTLDFDMKANPLLYGAMIGGQLSWHAWQEKIQINPFGFMNIAFGGECKPYEVTTLRTGTRTQAESGTCLNGETGIDFQNESGLGVSGLQFTGGINIAYLPWDLSMNITAPLIRKQMDSFSNTKSTIVTISKSFGNYKD